MALSEFGRELVPGYIAWREHHKLCWHCGRYDWFEPGWPLCVIGHRLYECWVRHAVGWKHDMTS